jgi:signal transduction histidine kinase
MAQQDYYGEADFVRLRDQYNELASLAGSLAHEIKNPLSVILMNMDLLAEDLSDGDTPREQRLKRKVAIVQEQCTRLENLLNDFLRFARLSHLELTPGNLNEIVSQVLGFFDAQADENHIEVMAYLDHSLPTIMIHRETLYAAILNLVKNAFEALSKGGHLVARTYVSSQGVALDLIDDGCGIDDRTAMKMFEAFSRPNRVARDSACRPLGKSLKPMGGRFMSRVKLVEARSLPWNFPSPNAWPNRRWIEPLPPRLAVPTPSRFPPHAV